MAIWLAKANGPEVSPSEPFNEEHASALYAAYLIARINSGEYRLHGRERGSVSYLLWVRGWTCGRIAHELRASVGAICRDVRAWCNAGSPAAQQDREILRERRQLALAEQGVTVRPSRWKAMKAKRRAKRAAQRQAEAAQAVAVEQGVENLPQPIQTQPATISDRKLRQVDPAAWYRKKWAAQAQPKPRPAVCLSIPDPPDFDYAA